MNASVKVIIASLLLTITGIANGQPETYLYLFDIQSKDDCYEVANPKYLSSFNPRGYTDQPSFTPLGDILVTAKLEKEDQHDIWILSPETNTCKRLTQTSADEFAPRVTPDGRYYSVLRQEEGDSSSRQVWQFPVIGGKYKSVTKQSKGIGQYAWINEHELGLFCKDGSQQRLTTYNRSNHLTTPVITTLASTMLSDRMGSLFYVQKQSEDTWYLKQYTHDTHNVDVLEETPVQSEVLAIMPGGIFFLSQDSKIYSYEAGDEGSWNECADLSKFGIHHISRIAISPDGKQMAVVASCE